jgi:hypothetical protein
LFAYGHSRPRRRIAPFPHVRSDAATGFTFSKKSGFRFLRNIYVAVVLALAVSATIVRPVMHAPGRT